MKLKVIDAEGEMGTIFLVEGKLSFGGTKKDALEGLVTNIMKRKQWTADQAMENLPQYLTGNVYAEAS